MGIPERQAMSEQPFNFTLRLEDFDLSRLPIAADVLRADPDLLAEAISKYYTAIFQKLGGTANVAIADAAVHVSWHPETGEARHLLFDHALSLLKKGNYREADPILHSLHARYPDDEKVLFNYGMMLSDQGRLDVACRLLGRFVQIVPDDAPGWTALGVALARSDDKPEALKAFRRALQLDPVNAYALRNAGAILSETDPAEALPFFEQAAEILTDDQQTLLGYGTCLLRLGRTTEADPILTKCIAVNPLSDTAEHARTARTKLAHQTMRNAVAGDLRPDVLMYCLDALKYFEKNGRTKTGAVTMEIAMLGRGGLDINHPAQKYTLRSLPGNFSGMRLVSMMYVGFKVIAPEHDAGIDLSREYAQSKKLFESEKGKGTG
jgi:Flp pilus assembly protein TadD